MPDDKKVETPKVTGNPTVDRWMDRLDPQGWVENLPRGARPVSAAAHVPTFGARRRSALMFCAMRLAFDEGNAEFWVNAIMYALWQPGPEKRGQQAAQLMLCMAGMEWMVLLVPDEHEEHYALTPEKLQEFVSAGASKMEVGFFNCMVRIINADTDADLTDVASFMRVSGLVGQ